MHATHYNIKHCDPDKHLLFCAYLATTVLCLIFRLEELVTLQQVAYTSLCCFDVGDLGPRDDLLI